MAMSGRFRFRKGTFGNLILEVEVVGEGWWKSREKKTWRRAKPIDLAAPELRLLIDLSNGRPLVPLSRAVVGVRPDKPEKVDQTGPSFVSQRADSSVAVH